MIDILWYLLIYIFMIFIVIVKKSDKIISNFFYKYI